MPTGDSILDKILKELEDRPFYEKVWASIKMTNYWLNSIVRNIIYNKPENIQAKNDVAHQIKEDIEFGYTTEMIYGKILAGSYGNEKIDESKT